MNDAATSTVTEEFQEGDRALTADSIIATRRRSTLGTVHNGATNLPSHSYMLFQDCTFSVLMRFVPPCRTRLRRMVAE